MYLKLLVAVQLDEVSQCVGNKAKGRNSKWMFKENKARRISRKTNIFPPLMRTRTCAYQGGDKKLSFFGKIRLLSFLEHSFGDSPFFPYYQRYVQFTSCVQGVDLRLVCLGCDVKGNNGTK